MQSDNEYGSSSARVELQVLGISYSHVQNGAYAVILAQKDGPYRIPIIVGTAEAQSIAFALEGIVAPRPLTHDLVISLCHAYSICLIDVFIHKFEDGIFSSELTFVGGDGTEIKIDARTSDAIGIAVRTGTRIFTTPEIVKETGFIMEIHPMSTSDDEEEPQETDSYSKPINTEHLSIEELEERLQQHIANEEYEEAAIIKSIITKRRQGS